MRLINCKSNPPKKQKKSFRHVSIKFRKFEYYTTIIPPEEKNSISVQSYFVHCLKKIAKHDVNYKSTICQNLSPPISLYLCSPLLPKMHSRSGAPFTWVRFGSMEPINFEKVVLKTHHQF